MQLQWVQLRAWVYVAACEYLSQKLCGDGSYICAEWTRWLQMPLDFAYTSEGFDAQVVERCSY